MQLPRSAEYALRALAVIALRDGVVSADEIASEATVPPHYLHKVLRRLTAAGILEARKGPGGGFSLARPANRIRVIDVLEATDAQLADDCAFGWGSCDARHPCPLHGTWSELKDAVDAWASKTTLADVHRYATVVPLRRRAR
jgi:Rrf2 family transcriptional regulator, iron-sulfur cluster assembly transcription factor